MSMDPGKSKSISWQKHAPKKKRKKNHVIQVKAVVNKQTLTTKQKKYI